MRVAIRVDASRRIGAGHVMRCLTLAEHLKSSGATITFLCRELDDHPCEFVAARGYDVCRLPAGESDANADGDQTIDALQRIAQDWDWIVVDHYDLDWRWESKLRRIAKRIMVIDDLANRRHDCDVLLDQNFHGDVESRYDGLVPNGCRLLLGPKYALLRNEFEEARRDLRSRTGDIKRILVFFGSGDPTNETEKALDAIRMLARPDIAVDVVIGSANAAKERIASMCAALPNVTLHRQTSNMAELMAAADLALGAGGATTWERCCLGLPSVVVTVAENQETLSAAMAEHGYSLYLGRNDRCTAAMMRETIAVLAINPAWLRFMSRHATGLVDGRGAYRVLRQLKRSMISLRRAEMSDCENIYRWRNDEATRRHSNNSAPISLAQHESWFAATLSNSDRVMLVGEAQGEAIGVLRYDLDGNRAEVSIYLVPGKYGQGYGVMLLEEGNKWIRTHRGEIDEITAIVRSGNAASMKMFLETGFREDSIQLNKRIGT